MEQQHCDRCHAETFSTIMSMFDTAKLCPNCKKAERNHPDYEKAVKADHDAIRNGDFNFKGIGYRPIHALPPPRFHVVSREEFDKAIKEGAKKERAMLALLGMK